MFQDKEITPKQGFLHNTVWISWAKQTENVIEIKSYCLFLILTPYELLPKLHINCFPYGMFRSMGVGGSRCINIKGKENSMGAARTWSVYLPLRL